MNTLTVDYNHNSIRTIQLFLDRVDPEGLHLISYSGLEAQNIIVEQPLDVVFLEADLKDINGLEVGRWLKRQQPECDLVFITGNGKYAVRAFELYASGYLIKPVREQELEEALMNLRHVRPVNESAGSKRLRIQCFGRFEVRTAGAPVSFKDENAKMLLAFLIDRNGTPLSFKELSSALVPGVDEDLLRIWIANLQTTLTLLGFGELLVREKDMIGLKIEMLDCDYYEYLNNGSYTTVFRGEYMSQYSFEKIGLSVLERIREEALAAMAEQEEPKEQKEPNGQEELNGPEEQKEPEEPATAVTISVVETTT
ncbi:MAG: response regulator [Lachnospiraceae bacterium]|nr:response regulator [Lachnospiraceae bacterium]